MTRGHGRSPESTTLTVEQGIALYVARYRPDPPDPSVAHIVSALGYLDDVTDDPALPVPRARIADYWSRRQEEIAGALDPAPVSTHRAMRPRTSRRQVK